MQPTTNMAKDTVELPDGRYLIYYTFEPDEAERPPRREAEPGGAPPGQARASQESRRDV